LWLICCLIQSVYTKKFDYTLFLSPYSDGFDLEIPKDRYSESLSLDWIISKISNEHQIRKISNCLVIIDDLVSSITKDYQNPELINFFFNRRKLIPGVEISIICTTQKYTLFPARFRSSIQWMVLFKIPVDDLKTVTSQQLYSTPPHLNHILNGHFKNPFSFVFIKLDKFGIFLNFEKQI